jgi:hypothetical protein
LIDCNTIFKPVGLQPGEQTNDRVDSEKIQKQNSEGDLPTTKIPTNTTAAHTRTFRLIVCRHRRFPDPKYCKSIQLGGENPFRPFALMAKQTTARAPKASSTLTTSEATAIHTRAQHKNSREADRFATM